MSDNKKEKKELDENHKKKHEDLLRKSTGLFKKPSVVSRDQVVVSSEVSVTLVEFEHADVKGATMLTGFPGATLTSILVAGFLRDAMELPLIGCITSPHFPPRCLIEKGQPMHPIRIFGDSNLVIVVCEFKLPTPELIAGVTQAAYLFAERHELAMVLTVEGLPMEKLSEDKANVLAFVSTSDKFRSKMSELKHEPLEDSVIVGVAGAMLAEATTRDIDVACLVAPTSAEFPDARSAVACVKAIDHALEEITIDTKPLQKKAEALSLTVEKLLKQEKSESKSVSSMYL
mmetsp:Transcript_1946/g.3234  ORF Transcript_1946/g.3234 Transcript_1946/m.3234 type:complete len:288 (+) Transcript_1946:44-907(+)